MHRVRRRTLAWTLVLLLGFGTGVFFMTSLGSSSAHHEWNDPPANQAATHGRALLKEFSAAFEEAAARVNPSVVPIYSETTTKMKSPFDEYFGDQFFHHFFGNRPNNSQRQTVKSLGSGVIVSHDGYILTNNHVVDGADKLTVELKDKRKYTAKVIGRDPQSDIAVIKITATDLPAATLGNSDSARVGEWVIAVGNPFELMHSVTAGIISAKGRSQENLAAYEDFIQTDASINPGNSGGALADLDGNVIGINTAIYSPSGTGNIGIGFAIPINMAKSVMNSLIEHGKVSRGYLGLIPQDIDEGLAKGLNLKTTEGVLVGDVSSGAPAEKAGVKRGDIITQINGTKVTSASQLRKTIAEDAPGSSAALAITREGKQLDITVKLGERPNDAGSTKSGDENSGGEQTTEKLGLAVEALTSRSADELGYKGDQGVVVTSVNPGTPAEEAGLQRGDLIKEVDRKPIGNVDEFKKAVGTAGKDDSIALLVRRGPNTFFVAIQQLQ